MSRRLTTTAALALAAIACSLGAAACGGDGSSPEQRAADRRGEARWQSGLTRWSADMVGALNNISTMFAREESVNRLRSGEAQTRRQLARFERTLAGCTATITRLGEPPHTLAAVRQEALRACKSLERGARFVQDGVLVWRNGGGIAALDRAYYELGSGQRGIARVRAALKTALGSGRASS
jgi:hypothetical protein